MKKIKALTLVAALLATISCSQQEAVEDSESKAPSVVEIDTVQESHSNIVVEDSNRL